MINKFSFSQTLLALAIFALAWSLFNFTQQLPQVVQVVDKTTDVVSLAQPKIDDIIAEVALVREEVGKVREVVAKQTPEVLKQVEATLPVINNVVAESGYYSAQLPQLLEQIDRIEKQVAQLQTSLPSVLASVDDLVQATDKTVVELGQWRPHSSEYLKEIAMSRDYIPQYITRIENTVENAKTVGSSASSGMVTGFFKGVLSLPFEVVSGLTNIVDKDSRSAKYLTAQDIALIQEKSLILLNGNLESVAYWHNTDSGNRGSIKKGKQIMKKDYACHELTFNNHFSKEKETLTQLMCIDEKGLWKVI